MYAFRGFGLLFCLFVLGFGVYVEILLPVLVFWGLVSSLKFVRFLYVTCFILFFSVSDIFHPGTS